VLRFKKAVMKVGEAGGKILMKVMEAVATDAAKKSLGV
jgi:hypothetical protein